MNLSQASFFLSSLKGFSPPLQQREPFPPALTQCSCSQSLWTTGSGRKHAGGQKRRWTNTPLLHSQRTTPRGMGERLRDVLSLSCSSFLPLSFSLGLQLWLLSMGVSVWMCACESQAAPAGLVPVQVTHHGLAEEAGLGEAVPLLEERLHDVRDEPWGGQETQVWTLASEETPSYDTCSCCVFTDQSEWLGQSLPAGYTEDWSLGQTFFLGHLSSTETSNKDMPTAVHSSLIFELWSSCKLTNRTFPRDKWLFEELPALQLQELELGPLLWL